MSFVTDLFGGGGNDNPPPPPPQPPPPVIPPTIEDASTSARENEDAMNRRKGRAATVLTGKRGAGTPMTAAKTLTGE